MSAALLPSPSIGEHLISAAVQLLPSPQSRRAYSSRLRSFLAWAHYLSLDRLTVESYIGHLISSGKSISSRNQSLAAIKRLAQTAADHHAISAETALSILRIKGSIQKGARAGNWLSKEECARLLETKEGADPLYEARDRSAIALLLGCGMRREEAAQLIWSQLQDKGRAARRLRSKGEGGAHPHYPRPSLG